MVRAGGGNCYQFAHSHRYKTLGASAGVPTGTAEAPWATVIFQLAPRPAREPGFDTVRQDKTPQREGHKPNAAVLLTGHKAYKNTF